MGKTLGFILIAGGIIVGIIVTVLMVVYRGEGRLSGGRYAAGHHPGLLVLVLPQLGFGAFLLWKGGQGCGRFHPGPRNNASCSTWSKHAGQIAISDLVIELNRDRETVQKMLYQLVGMGLFSGYVNWDEGMLYSRQAKELPS
jgi:hypothetical protein